MGSEWRNGWNEVTLSDVGEINRGRSRHRPRYAEHLYGGPFPFVQTGDVKAANGRIVTFSQTYSEAGLAQSRLWPAGTLCITIAANIAETAILTFPACFPDSIVGFIGDLTKVDVVFVEYLLRSMRSEIQHLASGTVQDNINLETLKQLKFPLPPLSEQKAIAHILGTLDDRIELNRKMNETLEAMARALFQSWFVDFEPVRAKMEGRKTGLPPDIEALFPSRLVPSELGDIPEGWRVGTLADYSELNPENWARNARPAEIRYVDLSNTKWGRIESISHLDESAAPSRAQRILRKGDTILGTVRPGNGSYAQISEDGLTGSTGFAVLRPKQPSYREFVYLLATAPANIERLEHLADGGAYPAVRPEIVHATSAMITESRCLRLFSDSVSHWLTRLSSNEAHSRTLASLRDALLPKLVSGELRVKDAETWLAQQGGI